MELQEAIKYMKDKYKDSFIQITNDGWTDEDDPHIVKFEIHQIVTTKYGRMTQRTEFESRAQLIDFVRKEKMIAFS